MAIVTVLASKTNIRGYHDRPGHQNRHGYCDCPGHRNRHGYYDRAGLKTDMAIMTVLASKPTFIAIVTALAIETDMAIMTILASKLTWLL